MSLIRGIHHVSMKCGTKEEYERVLYFYQEVLELPIVREWAEGVMLAAGAQLIEVFTNGEGEREKGVIRHFAFAVSDTEACAKRVAEAGFEVFMQPKDVVIPSNPPYPAKIAFCHGPLGEEIEFFEEK